jgi:hypothetical protein
MSTKSGSAIMWAQKKKAPANSVRPLTESHGFSFFTAVAQSSTTTSRPLPHSRDSPMAPPRAPPRSPRRRGRECGGELAHTAGVILSAGMNLEGN